MNTSGFKKPEQHEELVKDAGISWGFLAYLLIFVFFILVGVLGRPILGFDRWVMVVYGVLIGVPLLALFIALHRKSVRDG